MSPVSTEARERPRRVAVPARPAVAIRVPQPKPPPPDWVALTPRSFYARHGKAAFEAALLALVVPLAFVVALPVAIANWIQFKDIRRVLFAQARVGHRGRVFTLYKFRTMADASSDAFDSWSEGKDQARVTRFGRFLRNSHLDELPQLLNVLKGDMVLIGPRPEMVEIEEWAAGEVPGFVTRLAVPPGITGWAQVVQGYTGRDVAAYRRKLALGLEYARRPTFAIDLRILAWTVRDVVGRRGWRWREDAMRARGAS